MQQLADQDAKELENSIEQAVRSYNPQIRTKNLSRIPHNKPLNQ